MDLFTLLCLPLMSLLYNRIVNVQSELLEVPLEEEDMHQTVKSSKNGKSGHDGVQHGYLKEADNEVL